MSKIFVDQVDPKTATTLTLGTTGDTVTTPVGVVTSLDGAVTVNDSSNDVDFRVESDGNANMLTVNGGSNIVGVAADPDLGVGLHIKSADSGASVSVHADELVIEGSANSGMTILSGTSSNGRIMFGDSGDNDIGYIEYDHSSNQLALGANAASHIKIDSAGAVTKPNQPAFSAHVTSNVDPGSTSDYTVPYATEIFDNNADYNTTNYTFTAPVTGRYLFSTRVQGYDVATSFDLAHSVVTSNRTYHGGCGRFYDTDGYNSVIVAFADMDASDTAITVVNSNESSFYISSYSYFNGQLVC